MCFPNELGEMIIIGVGGLGLGAGGVKKRYIAAG